MFWPGGIQEHYSTTVLQMQLAANKQQQATSSYAKQNRCSISPYTFCQTNLFLFLTTYADNEAGTTEIYTRLHVADRLE